MEAVKNQATIKDLRLPLVATLYDYKANNIIFTPSPYLIDPDNATWLPRIFDLALVLLLFHNELDTAPDRIFTPTQWKLFLEGYKTYTTLTEFEKEVWDAVLQHIFLDEVMWLMAEYEEDWLNQNQYNLFRSLVEILFNSADYKI
ncbi:phosphotransferase [uncultured Rummeliibacillus sp.]|uniref:phosphotransferase n=1 Tax=uncultured Rummeliibacillus sp. TaxID=762292 RepID=UPI00345D0B50